MKNQSNKPNRLSDDAKNYTAATVAKMQKLVDVWPNVSSLADAVHAAGWNAKDRRAQARYKARAEEYFGITLEAHNPQFKSAHNDTSCPSTLDVNAARQASTFVITSATNNSNLHTNFWQALQLFAADKRAQQLVIPVKYRHNTLISRDDYAWPKEVIPFVLKEDVNISEHFRVSGGRPQATAINPLGGLDILGGRRTTIYGHPQIALRSIATVKTAEPKMIMTTGSVTSKKYTPTISGMKGSFFHSFAATFVHVYKGHPFHIQLHWDGRGFYFLDEYWTSTGLKSKGHKIAALVGGDAHLFWENKVHTLTVMRAMGRLDPDAVVWHDIHDHAHQGKYLQRLDRAAMARKGAVMVEDELNLIVPHLRKVSEGRQNIIVQSNHDEHLDQWLDKFNPKYDPANDYFASKLMVTKMDAKQSALQAWLGQQNTDGLNLKFVDSTRAHMVKGVNTSLHGDKGPNGSRGSLAGIARLPDKTFIGHSHSAGIMWGCYQVGTRTRAMSYAKGHSSWSLTDGIIYPNGKQALLVYKLGKSLVDFF